MLRVSDIALGRTNREAVVGGAELFHCQREAFQFQGVADRGSTPVDLSVAQSLRGHTAGHIPRGLDDLGESSLQLLVKPGNK